VSAQPEPRRTIDVRGLLVGLLAAAVFVGCLAVVVVNQQTVGWPNLAAMLGALAALIAMLALYNRRFR